MKGRFGKLLAIALVWTLLWPSNVFGDVSAAAGKPGSDLQGHWAEKEWSSWIQNGWIRGYGDGTYRPDQPMTRAEFAALVNRALGFAEIGGAAFTDLKPEDAAYPEIGKAVAAGYMDGFENGTVRPAEPVTRQEAAVMLFRAFRLEPVAGGISPGLRDLAAMPAWSKPAATALWSGGYVKGSAGGAFNPARPVTRAEAVALLNRLSGKVLLAPGTFGGDHARNMIIQSGGVTLKDAVIPGNLYLSEAMGGGEVVLRNVKVAGKVFVWSGGKDTLTLIDSDIGDIVIDKQGGDIRLTAQGTTAVRRLTAVSGAVSIHIEEDSTIESVDIRGDQTIPVTGKGKITSSNSRLIRQEQGQAQGQGPESGSAGTGSSSASSGSGASSSHGSGSAPVPNSPPGTGIPSFANVSVHDPSIIKDGGAYYVFGSHIEAAKSTDLMHWTRFTNGYDTPGNVLYGDLSANLAASFAWAGEDDADSKGGFAVWAPDVFWNKDYKNEDGTTGAYMMYYSASSTYIRSAIGYAVSKKIEGPYRYVDTVIYTGFARDEAYDNNSDVNKKWDNTNIKPLIEKGALPGVKTDWFNGNGSYNNASYPNAIDPTLFYDKNGKLWMTYGSWSGGIFVLELDPATGQVKYPGQDGKTADGRMIDRYFGIHIAGGYTKSGEGPFILYDEDTGYYYLTVTYGGLAANGGYNMRLFRAGAPEGPYVDAEGKGAVLPDRSAANTAYGIKMIGNFLFEREIGDPGSGPGYGYVSPGHNSLYFDEKTGKRFLIFHTRFPQKGEAHEVRVHQLFLNKDGWLVTAPAGYTGETVKPVSARDVTGDYKFVNHGLSYSGEITKSVPLRLKEDGSVAGDITGTWKLSDGYRASLTLNGVTYDGVFVRQWDETRRAETMTFTASSKAGETIWGIRQPDKSDESLVADVRQALTLGDTSKVMANLALPARGARGTLIAWKSSDPGVITDQGVISPPEPGQPNRTATLTATITKGNASAVKTFSIVVVPVDISAGLVAHYGFEENLKDSSGRFGVGVVTGDRIDKSPGGNITFGEGVNGKAAAFDGASGIRLPDGLIQGNKYSVSLWLNPEKHTANTTTFFGGTNKNWISLVPQAWDNNTMLWSGEAWYDGTTGSRIRANQWSHIAFTVDGDAVKVYVDGVLKYSGAGFPDVFKTGKETFGLGVNWWDAPFLGRMDEVRVYNVPITDALVAKLAAARPDGVEPPAELTAKFSFEGNLADTVGGLGGTVVGEKIDDVSAGGVIGFADGVNGKAAVFDGKSGVLLPKGLISSPNYSVTMWVYADRLTTYTPAFFGAQTNNSWISLLPAGPEAAGSGGGASSKLWSGSSWYDAVTGVSTPLRTWTHLAFTVNRGKVTVYVNGEAKFTGAGFPDIFTDDQGTFALGVNWWDPPFQGMLDELHVYKGALSAEQVADLAAR
ncbi:LamG-like jellyroll fold domain-containing protein [Paenibacillus sanfengchensis]|uniref:LamG-like jellyroll fold domain-containing protein n=1 Tax=Paenibacillus sanfengchensis TaxID=3119819 RepID=UPI002FE278F1